MRTSLLDGNAVSETAGFRGFPTLNGGRVAPGAMKSLVHDLNNVFSTIAMATELLRDGASRPEQLALLDEIENGLLRGVDVVDRVTDLMKGGSPR